MNGNTAHQEKHFEQYVVAQLKKQGWKVGDTKHYDTEAAMYPEDLVAWLTATQPEKWKKLQKDYPDDPAMALMDRVARVLEKEGTVYALRRGLSIAGCGHIDLSEAAPEDQRNAEVLKRYAANILRVVPQLKYHPARELAIDLAFFINGLAVATVELKTDFTQSAAAAVAQYKADRIPFDPKTKRQEPLLTFKRGAVVHFAMSDSDIEMTTKLDGENTLFLPFNQGNDEHKGNPPRADGEYPIAYFWERVCQRDAWLRIVHSFVYVERKDVADIKGNWSKKETLMFPRFHQWDAVNRMIADAKANGAGAQYLCEHSAGSGKTSTIAWTAHDLIKLRADDGTPIFDSVVIVTDRTVLDSQLQEAVKQIDHQFGVIAAIDRSKSSKSKSKQLAEALIAGVPIVVVTIQTFPYAMEAMVTDPKLKNKHFAVIIDEAHNSQTGTNAAKLQTALSMGSQGGTAALTVEELLERLQKSRVQPKNISHFAFTATPKHSTFMLFGRTRDGKKATKENVPQAFHRYPMRQAIEEGFILDVLQGYVPYKTAFNLAKQMEDGKRVSGRAATRALAQWMALHPTNVTQKVQFIVEHFAANVMALLDSKAKAMVVTSSRAAAVRYKRGFDAFVAQHPQYAGIHSLVAFSGKLTGKQVMHAEDERLEGDAFIVDAGEVFTEQTMNPGVSGDLAKAFEKPEYRVMLVADKFQTGFDQPKLVAMYIDKKIANDVEIVQTLSRLNRTAPGKDVTFVIDFVNDPEAVREAFAKYDKGAVVEEVQDPNVVYEIKESLDKSEFYEPGDLEAFKQARFRSIRDITAAQEPQHKALYAATERPTRLFNQRVQMLRDALATAEATFEKARVAKNKAAQQAADHERHEYAKQLRMVETFKSGLGRFVRTYGYIAQLIDLGDPELENYAAFARLLQKRLDGVPPDHIDLHGLVLAGFDITARQSTPVAGGDTPVLRPIGPGGGEPKDDRTYLKEIIERLNHLFGDATPLRDQVAFVNHIAGIAGESDVVMAQVENNSREQALKGNLPGAIQQGVVRSLTSYQKQATQVLKADRQGMATLVDIIYDVIRSKRPLDLDEPHA